MNIGSGKYGMFVHFKHNFTRKSVATQAKFNQLKNLSIMCTM